MSLLVYLLVQTVENAKGKPLFSFPGDKGYEKETKMSEADVPKWKMQAEVTFVTVVSAATIERKHRYWPFDKTT